MSGFGWDEELQRVTATDGVWDSLAKAPVCLHLYSLVQASKIILEWQKATAMAKEELPAFR